MKEINILLMAMLFCASTVVVKAQQSAAVDTASADTAEYCNYSIIDTVLQLPADEFSKWMDTLNLYGNTDYFSLRLAFTATPEYSPYISNSSAFDTIDAMYSRGELDAAIDKAEQFCRKYPVNIKMRWRAAVLCDNKGDSLRAKYHQNWVLNLTRAIINSGDGKSPKSAYLVLDVDEEYWMLKIMEYKMKKQSLVRADGHAVDLLECVDMKDQTSHEVYFNVDLPMKSYLPKDKKE